MSHLPTERLAALADDAPTTEELAHLASCELCARERANYTVLLANAGEEYSRIGAPLTSWESLRRALLDDGIIDAGRADHVVSFGGRRRSGMRAVWQAAAAVLLVAGGVAAGRLTAGVGNRAADSGSSGAVVAPNNNPAQAVAFSDVDEARRGLRQGEALYQSATAYLAAHDTTLEAQDSPAAMRTRLAALDVVDETMREAMHHAPADPVINSYYLNAIGQKEATLQQLNAVLPRSASINSF